MKNNRGHDVSPDFKWYPFITFIQLLFDLPMADKVPRGNAHNYSANNYLDGWIEVTQPKKMTVIDEERIREYFIND